jgi:hypothetical protein
LIDPVNEKDDLKVGTNTAVGFIGAIFHRCDKEHDFWGRLEFIGFEEIIEPDDPTVEMAKTICNEAGINDAD